MVVVIIVNIYLDFLCLGKCSPIITSPSANRQLWDIEVFAICKIISVEVIKRYRQAEGNATMLVIILTETLIILFKNRILIIVLLQISSGKNRHGL